MKFGFHPEARVEYREAAAFYEGRRRGLGSAFSFQMEFALSEILHTPKKFLIFEGDVRICRIQTFPFAILFTLEQEYTIITAVMRLRRRPGDGRQRVSKPTT